jgi:hypothetical protein
LNQSNLSQDAMNAWRTNVKNKNNPRFEGKENSKYPYITTLYVVTTN